MNLNDSGKIRINHAGDCPGSQANHSGQLPSNEKSSGGTPGLEESM